MSKFHDFSRVDNLCLISFVSDFHGHSGIPVEIITNYYKVEKMPEFSLNQYRVDFEPDIVKIHEIASKISEANKYFV